jgi:hypothetical protein
VSLSAVHAPGSAAGAAAGALKQLVAFPAASFARDSVPVSPPDTQMAVGPSYVAEAVNNVFTVGTRAGRLVQSTDLNTFFQVAAGFSFTDPRLVYDALSRRWFMSGLDFDLANASDVYVAVSDSADPTAGWSIYTLVSYAGTVTDQPKIGVSSDKLVISWNDFTSSTTFTGQETWVVQKSDLLAAARLRISAFEIDTTRFDLVPAVSQSATSTEYVVYNNTCSANAGIGTGSCTTGGSSLGVVAISGTPANSDVTWIESDPALAQTANPPLATQPHGPAIDTNDDRILSAVWQNGALWATANDGCLAGGIPQSCMLVIHATTTGTPAIVHAGLLGASGYDDYFPAVALDGQGNAFVAGTVSSASIYPSVVVFGGPPTPALFSSAYVWVGTGPYACSLCAGGGPLGSNRWGDYSTAVVDPTNPADVWVGGEYGTAAGGDNWGTAIGEVTLNGPSVSDPIATHTTFNCDIRSQANGRYVSAELGYTGALYAALRARSTRVGPWEKYQCVAIGTNRWAIRSRANGRYVSAELAYAGALQGTLRARASRIGSWEQFTIVRSGTRLALRSSANNKYVSSEVHDTGSLYGLLRARAATLDSWETYAITIDPP